MLHLFCVNCFLTRMGGIWSVLLPITASFRACFLSAKGSSTSQLFLLRSGLESFGIQSSQLLGRFAEYEM